MLTGFLAHIVGLVFAADVYGATVMVMAVASLVAILMVKSECQVRRRLPTPQPME